MKCQTDSESIAEGVKEPDPSNDPSEDISEDVVTTNGINQDPPDVSLEWKDVKVSFP